MFLKCVPPSDDLFQHLARDLSYRRFKGLIPDSETFEEYLHGNKALRLAMDTIDAPHKAEREATQAARVQKLEEQTCVKQENREYHTRAKALRTKILATTGGMIYLSGEQAQLKREPDI